jgi:hypothetical protein
MEQGRLTRQLCAEEEAKKRAEKMEQTRQQLK